MQALVIDDDIATLNVIEDKVDWKSLGIDQVHTAYNVTQAKHAILEHDISVIISDIEMPQGSGIDLLEWYRQQNYQGEFIFLTCHESFDYAVNALKYGACEYLLKPFDVSAMEAALRKIVVRLVERQRQDEVLDYGKWAVSNRNRTQLSFIRAVLEGRDEHHYDMSKLELKPATYYRLVVSKVTDIEHAADRMSPGLLGFVLENVHSEIFTGTPENCRVVTMQQNSSSYVIVSVCDDMEEAALEKKANEVISQVDGITKISASCCISKPVRIENFYSRYEACVRLLMSNVIYFKKAFLEDQISENHEEVNQVLDVSLLISFYEKRDKTGFMEYLKKVINGKVFNKSLNEAAIRVAQRDIWHAIYSYLAKKDIPADDFFLDDTSAILNAKAGQSVMDMMKWANNLIEQLFRFVDEANRFTSTVDRIKGFVREHYMENIGRAEIAREMGFSPEYVSKLFKKESGMNLSDYISGVRVEQAKNLLDKGEFTISEIAAACGFENQTYFSTIFKKYTGVTPNQYKKRG